MSSPSNIDLVEVTGILQELSALSKERNNNGSEDIPERLSKLTGSTDKYLVSSDSDSGIISVHRDEKMSDGETKPVQLSVRRQEEGTQMTSSKEDISSTGDVEDENNASAVEDTDVILPQSFSDSLEDELASRVEKSLADMQEILDNVGEELDFSDEEDQLVYQEKVLLRENSQDDIIDLTLTGLKREVITEENEDMTSAASAAYSDSADDAASHASYDSVQELEIGDSAAQCQLLEQRLRLERRLLTGEDVTASDVEGGEEEGQSEASYSGSDDSLHKQVERSLAGSTASLNQTIIASEDDSEHSEEYSSTIQGMNSRDELDIYDSRDLQNGVHQLMNDSQVVIEKERAKSPSNGSGVPAIFTINQLKRKFDSVDNIMDRIDAGISTLRTIEMPARQTPTEDVDQSEEKTTAAENVVTSDEPSKTPLLTDNMKQVAAKPYSKSAPNFDMSWQTSQSYSKPSFLHEEREESDGVLLTDDDMAAHAADDEDNMADEDSLGLSGADNLSDLDSDAASATNAKFSEILRNKQNTLGDPRVSALKYQEAGTETESIRTEDFESAFQKSLPVGAGNQSLRTLQAHSLAESTDTPLTEDFEDRFKSSLKFSQIPLPDPQRRPTAPIYSLPKARPSSVTKSSPVNKRRSPVTTKRTPTPPKRTVASRNAAYTGKANHKDFDIQRGVDTLDELSDIEPEVRTRMRPTSPHHAAPLQSNGYYEADTESEDGEFAQQIREQSNRIQKEIELERRLRTRQVQRTGSNHHPQMTEFSASEQPGYNSLDSRHNSLPRYRGSASHTNLPSAQDMHAFHSYSASTPDVSSLLAAQQQSSNVKTQLEEDSHVVKRLNDDRMQLLQEISRLQEELKGLEEEVRSTEAQAKENRSRAEESRSHLMVAEFKKEAVLKEINRLSAEVEQGKRVIEDAQERKAQEDNVLNSLGLTIQQVPGIIEDRDALKQKVEEMDRAAEREKDERSKQVENIKTESATQQENLQEKIDTLRDSVQRLNAHLERVSLEKDEFKKERDAAITKCDSLQRDMAAGEQAKAQALEQTIKGYDDMRRRLEKDSAETHTQLTNELNGIRKLLEIEEQKGAKLREEIELRDQLNESLREQLRNVRQKATDEEDSHDQLLRELKQQLRDCDNERLAAWDACKQQFEVEKDKLLEMTRDDLERQHSELLTAVREEHTRQVIQLQHANKNKESEAYALRDRLSQQEQETKRTVEALRADARRQVEEAVQSEKKIWEKEQKYLENEQLKQYREKEENQLDQVRLQLESESKRRQQIEEHLGSIKEELEESTQYNHRLNQEKLAISQKLKQAEDHQSNEVNKSKKELKQHFEKMMAALREELEEKDQQIERLRHENSAVVQSEAESSQALEKFEKMMIHEINEECKKTADLLGVQPRKAQTVSFSRSSSPSKARTRKRSTSRTVTASAVANLRACNEELRNSLAELKSEVTDLSTSVARSEKAKELELEQLRNRLSNEKRQEVEEMRMSVAKMPACRRSLTDPRDPYQVKVERKASEKSLRKSLSGSYTALNGSAPEYQAAQPVEDPRESSASHSMHTVQDRLRHIRAGSPFRYRSNPALTNPPVDAAKYASNHSLSTAGMESLEQKVRLAELKARLADERANRNQAILSQKMHEVNELQQTLNCQTKEIMGLERSYDDLRSAQYSPNRYSMLNSTFPH